MLCSVKYLCIQFIKLFVKLNSRFSNFFTINFRYKLLIDLACLILRRIFSVQKNLCAYIIYNNYNNLKI